MLTFIKVIAIILVVLFVLSWIIYFFNLDVKMASKMIPLFKKHYDKMERDRRL